MTYTVQNGKQNFIVSRNEAVYMASILWNISEIESEQKITALENLPSINSVQSLKIA